MNPYGEEEWIETTVQTTSPEPALVRCQAELEQARAAVAALEQEVDALDGELATQREELQRVRVDLGEQMRARAPVSELRSGKAKEADVALAIETAEALLADRRAALEGARQRVRAKQWELQSTEAGAAILRAQIAGQAERVARARAAIVQAEAHLADRCRLLAMEERALADLQRELAAVTGEGR